MHLEGMLTRLQPLMEERSENGVPVKPFESRRTGIRPRASP
jgi:hypothetical protein